MKNFIVVLSTCLLLLSSGNYCDNSASNKLSSITSNQDKNKISFTPQKPNSLPVWWENREREYALNDPRLVEYENVEFIGGFEPNIGEVFFVDGKEIIFKDKQIKINRMKNLISKSFTSGDYKIVMDWDENMSTGAYSEGTISLYFKGKMQVKTNFIQSGW